MNAAPPVRLDWSSAKSATPEIGRFTTKTSRALADAGAGTKVHQDHADHARAAAAAAATRAASRAVPALAGPQATSETLSIDAPTCVMDAPLDGLVGAVCRTAADAGPTNNYCFTSDVVTESFDATTLTIVANNCPDHVWGQGSNASTAYDDDGKGCCACGGCGSCAVSCGSCGSGSYDPCGTCSSSGRRALAGCDSSYGGCETCETCGTKGCCAAADCCSYPGKGGCSSGDCAACCGGGHDHGCHNHECGCGGCGCGGCGCGGDDIPKAWPVVRAYTYEIPTAPEVAATVTPLEEHEVLGVAVNGVELTSERIKGSFDSCAGHVLLRTRSYHYHALPTCLAESMGLNELTEGTVLGWALDGFPIKYDAAITDLDECRGATVDGEYAYYLTKKGGQACLKGSKGTVSNAAAADPKAVCPKQGKEVTFGADVVEGHSCPIQVALTGYLVDVASFDSDVDPETHDLKAACPDPTACAYGIAIASSDRRRLAEGYELRLLDDAGNAAAAAAVAGSSKASGWLVDARGELGSDGNVIGADVYVVGEVLSYTGIALDMQCWFRAEFPIAFDGVDMVTNPGEHNVWCMRDLPLCRQNGFGIMSADEDGRHGIKYAFSEKTNDMMLALIDATTKENQVVVTATGTPISAADAGVVNARNLAFDMFDASMLFMDGEIVSHTGFVIDLFCWDMPGHVAIDGADLDTSPEDHTVHCMRDIQQCRDNGFAVLRELDDGTYDIAYRLDEAGNQAVLAYMDSTPDANGNGHRNGETIVKVTGTLASGPDGLVIAGASVCNSDGENCQGSDPGDLPAPAPAPLPAPKPTSATAMDCTSDDPAFDFGLDLSSRLRLYWSIDGPDLRARLVKTGGGYGAIGISPNGLMPSSDVIAGESGEAPRTFETDGNSGISESNNVEIRDVSASETDGESSWDFTRALDAGKNPIKAAGATNLIWAQGDGSLGYHGRDRGAFSLDFSTCDNSQQKLRPVNSNAIRTHGMLMIAAWAYLSPSAVVLARTKNAHFLPGKIWLYGHALFQLAALICTAVALGIAVNTIGRADGVDHLSGRHQKLGVGVGVAAGLNMVMGALRPHAPGPDQDKTALRFAFEIAHRLVGYGCVVLAAVTMFSGVHKAYDLEHIHQVRTWNTAIIAPLAVSAFLIAAATAYIAVKKPAGARAAADGDIEKELSKK